MQADPASLDGWVALRQALWPASPPDRLRREAERWLDGRRRLAMLALPADGAVAGFAEASLRHDPVNGCETSPVAFLEGIYVTPCWRRQGVAGALVAAVAGWGRANGCRELASDADIANRLSQAMHRALGFEATERVVFFRRRL